MNLTFRMLQHTFRSDYYSFTDKFKFKNTTARGTKELELIDIKRQEYANNRHSLTANVLI